MSTHELPQSAGPSVPDGRVVISHVNADLSATQTVIDTTNNSPLPEFVARTGRFANTVIEFAGQGDDQENIPNNNRRI
jgi:hypothetical protein